VCDYESEERDVVEGEAVLGVFCRAELDDGVLAWVKRGYSWERSSC